MSKIIEERITKMSFDNGSFERDVSQSINTIDKLKKSLNMENAGRSLSSIADSGVKVKNSFASALDDISNKFSTLQIAAGVALGNIVTSAVNAGANIVKSLTIQPIMDGFSEYETQLNAVQTILANTQSKGSTLDDVNKALSELNKYADLTIYNFTEMTRNIGTFTAAGVGLEDSVNAIKGIANLAAVSGSTSQQASTAMYQLSQALAAGKVQLMDWNSVVNAGMGGELFQNALIRTARVMGTGVDAAIEKYGNFRESLTKSGWLTAEVLTETLSQISGAYSEAELIGQGFSLSQAKEIMTLAKTATDAATKVKTFTQLMDTVNEAVGSGWATTWQLIIGDFEEAKSLWTGISEVITDFIGKVSDSRNEVLQSWKDLGGRKVILEGLLNIFKSLASILKPVGEAFRNAFPKMTGDNLYSISEKFRDLTKNLIIGDSVANSIKNTFSGLFSAINMLKNVMGGVAQLITPFIGIGVKMVNVILSITSILGGFVSNIGKAITKTNTFGVIFETLKSILIPITKFIEAVSDKLASFFNNVKPVSVDNMTSFFEFLLYIIKPLSSLGLVLNSVFSVLTTVLNSGFGIINTILKSVSKKVSSNIDSVINAFEPMKALGDVFKTVFDGLVIVIDYIGQKVKQALEWIGESISSVLGNNKTGGMLKVLNGGIFAAILLSIRKMINSFSDLISDGGGLFEGIDDILNSLKDTLSAYQSQLKAGTLIKIASAIAILAGSLLILSTIDPDKLTAGLIAMGVLMGELYTFMLAFDKLSTSGSSMTKASLGMIGLSTAILILSSALVKMGKLNWDEIGKGLTTVTGTAAVLVTSATLMSKSNGKIIKASSGLILFATALLILTKSITILGKIDSNKLIKGLGSVAILCAELAAFLKVSNFDDIGVRSSIGLIGVATALLVLSVAVDKLGGIKANSLIKGLGSIGVLLSELIVFSKLISTNKGMISTSISIGILSASMIVLGSAIEKMGDLTKKQIGKGLISMAGALTVIGIAMRLLPDSMMSKSIGISIIAGSLLILTKVLYSMSGFNWDEIGRGLTLLGGSLIIIATSMLLMRSALPGAAALLVITGALKLLVPTLQSLGSMNWTQIITGLTALAGIFGVIGLAGLILTPVIPAIALLAGSITLLGAGCLAAGVGVLALSTGLAALAAVGGAGITVVTSLVVNMINTIPLLVQKAGEGLIAFLNVIIKTAPVITNAFIVILKSLGTAIIECIPLMVECVAKLLTALLDLVIEYAPKVVLAGYSLLLALMKGLRDNISEIVEVGVDIIVKFLQGIAKGMDRIVNAAIDVVFAFVGGIIKGLGQKIPQLITVVSDAFTDVAKAGVDALKNSIVDFISMGADLVGGLIKGIYNGISGVVGAIVDVAKAAIKGGKEELDINSPSKEFETMGRFCDEGLANGLYKYSRLITDATSEVGDETISMLRETLSNIDLDDPDFNGPVIRPVIDLSNVSDGINTIDNMLENQNGTISLSAKAALANVRAIGGVGAKNISDNSELISAIKDLKGTLSNVSGDSYNINGITYDDGSNINSAVQTLVRAAKIGRRI